MKKPHKFILEQITQRTPKEMLSRLSKHVSDYEAFPTVVFVLQKAIEETQDEEKKERFKRQIADMMISGKEVIDHEVEKEIDEWQTQEIKKEIEMGNLSKKMFTHLFKKIKRLNTKQHGKKENKRIRR